jgi:hypothetical protein
MTKKNEKKGPLLIPEVAQEPVTETAKEEKSGAGTRLSYFAVMAAVSVIVSLSSVVVYDRYFAQKIVSVDLKGYMDDQRSQYAARKLSDEQLDKNLARVKGILEQIPKNHVVMMGDAVIKNAEVVKLGSSK